ncbi:MAG TPA: SH3 domain-containing protein, partial [Caldilineaceae bacterium]|nr:SH3 domain-containing protein [Caldilineaceae bacterium]
MALIETICGKSISRFASTVMLVLCPVILLACGPSSSSNGEPPVEQMAIRSPHPTFTPTPLDAAPPPPPAPSTLAADAPPQDSTAVTPSTNAAATQPAAPKAKLVINAEAVNLREGPSTDATIITMLLQGQEFDIIGKDATGKWWFICCSEDKAGWVTSEFADVSGPVDQIPVVADDATGPLPTAQVAVAVQRGQHRFGQVAHAQLQRGAVLHQRGDMAGNGQLPPAR